MIPSSFANCIPYDLSMTWLLYFLSVWHASTVGDAPPSLSMGQFTNSAANTAKPTIIWTRCALLVPFYLTRTDVFEYYSTERLQTPQLQRPIQKFTALMH